MNTLRMSLRDILHLIVITLQVRYYSLIMVVRCLTPNVASLVILPIVTASIHEPSRADSNSNVLDSISTIVGILALLVAILQLREHQRMHSQRDRILITMPGYGLDSPRYVNDSQQGRFLIAHSQRIGDIGSALNVSLII